MTKLNRTALIILLAVPLLIWALHSVTIIVNGCINANDFSMYQQAVMAVYQQGAANPFVPLRGTNMLNDHFEPILWLASLWTLVFGQSSVALSQFEILSFLALLVLPLVVFKNDMERILGVFLIVFSRALLQGLEFPVHPVTWSAPIAWYLGFAIAKQKYKHIFWAALVLPLFREIYPFMIIGLSFWLFAVEQKRIATILFTSMSAWISFSVWGRPYFLGPTAKFHGALTSDLALNPFLTLWKKLSRPAIQWNLFAQYLPLVIVAIYKRRLNLKNPIWGLLCFILPGIGIHVLVGRMAHHHGIPMALPIVGFLTATAVPRLVQEFKSGKIWLVCLLPLLLTSTSRYQRAIKNTFIKNDRCQISEEKISEVNELRNFSKTLDIDAKILASGDVVPIISNGKNYVMQISPFAYPHEYYDYLFISMPGSGDPWPLSAEELIPWKQRCLPYGEEVFSSKSYSVLKGKFDLECIGFLEIWAIDESQELRVNNE